MPEGRERLYWRNRGEELTVVFDSKGVSLTGYGLTYQGDFENMLHRVTNGRLQHEMLVCELPVIFPPKEKKTK